MTDERPCVQLKDAAERLKCTTQWVLRLMKSGKLEGHYTTPRKVFIYTDSIEAFINANNSHNQ